MLHSIYWFPIALKLRDFIKHYRHKETGEPLFAYLQDREVMKIRVGQGNAGEYPALYILFGDETELRLQDKIIGSDIQLWLDIYIRGAASSEHDYDDMLYRDCYRVEQELVDMLREFNFYLQSKRGLGLAANMRISSILSDGDENAPESVQHRVVLDLQVRDDKKLNRNGGI